MKKQTTKEACKDCDGAIMAVFVHTIYGGIYSTIGHFKWQSFDGEVWTMPNGKPVKDKEFKDMSIMLIGGNRHGEVIR